MTDYEVYTLILCIIVFCLLTILSIICVSIIAHLTVKITKSGIDDERIVKDYREETRVAKIKKSKVLDYVLSGTVCFVFLAIFVCSLVIRVNEDKLVENSSVYRVVRTGSMAEKHEKNKYLTENGLDDQIQMFDLICTDRLPDEMDLELYDIVVYEVDDMLIVHRIVGIEEPNASHPDCRYFRLQGDAVEAADRFPVTYDQMRAIYRGARIPFVGSFILFMQSTAGYLCIGLVIFAMIATPLLEAYLSYQRKKRLKVYIPELFDWNL